ncbi:hypothetical protein VNO77_34187 [Canavalia gladiata]|uniref:Uncharacterized protein n=1 Tax=Canavalia gladiata TaxID=3824 RepID=A0AAN9PYC0_CANGL
MNSKIGGAKSNLVQLRSVPPEFFPSKEIHRMLKTDPENENEESMPEPFVQLPMTLEVQVWLVQSATV